MYLPAGVVFDFLLDNAEAHLGLPKIYDAAFLRK